MTSDIGSLILNGFYSYCPRNGPSLNSIEIRSNQMLVLAERGKPEDPEKNLSVQSRDKTKTQPM